MIPLVDLKTQYGLHREAFLEAVEGVLNSSSFILGEHVAAFERKFAAFIGTRFAVGVASGTDALHLSLRACGVSPGDEVITAANTFFATVSAIQLAGARPVLVDCHPETCLMDAGALERAITPQTRAIIPVHLYGQVAPMDEITALAKGYALIVIEDACQAHGADYKGRRAGTFGAAAAFSFYPGKNLGAFGDGGAVTTDDDTVCGKLLALRNYGSTEKYHHPAFGVNSRLDALQAALLTVKLDFLEKWNAARQRAAARYRNNLKGCPAIRLPVQADHSTHVYHLFVIQVEGDRDALVEQMRRRDIQCGVHYPIPLHLQAACSGLGYRRGDFPHAEALAKKIISLPLFPEITDAQIDYVSASLVDCLRHGEVSGV